MDHRDRHDVNDIRAAMVRRLHIKVRGLDPPEHQLIRPCTWLKFTLKYHSAPVKYVYRNSSGPLNLKIMKRAWETSPAEQKNTVNYKTAKKSVRSAMSVHTAEHPPIPRDPRIQLSRVRTGGSSWRTSCCSSLWWWSGWSTGGVGWFGAQVGCLGRHRRAGSTSGSRLGVTRGTLLVE